MKFSNKGHRIYSCGDCLTRNKITAKTHTKCVGKCTVCQEETQWYSTTFLEHFCSDECLEIEMQDVSGIDVKWTEVFNDKNTRT
jgi:hypothetical protein